MSDFEVVAEGLANVEGPTAGPGDWVLNVCSLNRPEHPDWQTRAGDIVATRLNAAFDTRLVFNTSTSSVEGIPAALAFGPDGCIYVADEGRRGILRVPAGGSVEDFITSFEGERLNGANDLSFDSDGSLYFTDPWGSSADNPIGGVYGYDFENGLVYRIDQGMAFPNGIVAADGALLVAETIPRTVWRYDITGPGRAANKRAFCELPHIADAAVQGPDGMCLDADGNLYVAHYGSGAVYVYSRDASLLDVIPTPGRLPTNVCFAGEGHRDLLVTVDDVGLLVRYPNVAAGRPLPFCPSTATDVSPWLAALGQASTVPEERPYGNSG